MSDMRRLERVWVRRTDGTQEHILMEEVPPQLFEDKVGSARNNDGSNDTARPEFYKLEAGGLLTVSPTPDQDYTARVDYIQHIQQIKLDAPVDILPGYEDAVVMLAASYVLARPGSTQEQQALASTFAGQAREDVEALVASSAPNRTIDIDRTPVVWLR